ncbi:EHN domain-containing protein [Favolaschia claudopus]|uniref:EHN domain-containing protein n=1 Tax=Favolaschia claudopus TaxID=2862362 RepID=A0AAW0C5J5_9AGAR
MTENPFIVSVSDDELNLLQQKLAIANLPDELDDVNWAYGAPLTDIRRLVARWREGFDWRTQEARLNAEMPQFTRDLEVEGFGSLNVHYVHKKSDQEGAIPLLFVHGWPGSFIEARKILPMLTKPPLDQQSFHVVAVSLPGYGFSEAPKKKGFSISQFAEVCHKVMLALGYNEYVTQGGDWGGLITRKMAAMYGGKHIKAWHTNFPVVRPPEFSLNPITLFTSLSMLPALFYLFLFSPTERIALQRTLTVQRTGMAYFQIQATKPQTLGYALADSPVGLLAWIYEKLVAWSDGYKWEDDEVLTWISIYIFSRAGPAASLRIYYEASASGRLLPAIWEWDQLPRIPMGVSYFPGEMLLLPRSWIRRTGNVVFERVHDAGGHFAAHEVPELLVGDVRKMFRAVWGVQY